MSGPLPRRAIPRPCRQRAARVAAPGAIVAGLVATGLALAAVPSPTSATSASVVVPVSSGTAAPSQAAAPSPLRADALDLTTAKRDDRANRSAGRRPVAARKVEAQVEQFHALEVTGTRYATVALNVRTKADEHAELVSVLKAGVKVKITDTTSGRWRLIVRDGNGQWVKKQYLAKKRPDLSAGGGSISNAPCKGGSGMESGLTPDAVKVHRALCVRFPQVSSFGGVRQGDFGEHGSGRAVDAMISDSGVGRRMATWLRANAKRLGVSEVIYSQRIWTVQRSGDGWRGMSDRGSATANHYDHVHITVYGNSAG